MGAHCYGGVVELRLGGVSFAIVGMICSGLNLAELCLVESPVRRCNLHEK